MAEWSTTVIPPRETWAFDPHESPEKKIETPVDDRGIVIVPKLIESVAATIDPDYRWMLRKNIHHMYGREPHSYFSSPYSHDLATFCDLPTSKLKAPIDFHGWLEEVTLRPNKPSKEIMDYRIDAWQVALSLFMKARDLAITDKRARRRRQYIGQNKGFVFKHQPTNEDLIGEEWLDSEYEQNFEGFLMHLDLYKTVPREFMVAPLPEDDSPLAIASALGGIVTKGAVALPQRAFETAA